MSYGKARQKWWCRACRKWSFGSEARALDALRTVAEAHGHTNHKIPVRAYPCDYGNGYHLTSQKARV